MAQEVDLAQLELQLKVWKELAISKQLLMRSATDALKLDPNCTQEELKEALDRALKKVAEADASVSNAQEQTRSALAAMEKKLTASVQAHTAAQAANAELLRAQETTAKQMAAERAALAKEIETLKGRLADREKAIKAINTALSDTPENVVRKMKAYKKEKQEEADARRTVEASLNTLRKDKREQDKQLADAQENSVKLMARYRDLHALCVTLHDQLKQLADAKNLPELPELDSKLLEAIEQATPKPKK